MRLSFGQFIGRQSRCLENQGFIFSEMVHVGHQHVPEHTHVDAHFVLVVSGEYLTSARGVGPLCSANTVIFNPPGTTHRDRFLSPAGRFFTVSAKLGRFAHFGATGSRLENSVAFPTGDLSLLADRAYREFRSADPMAELVLEGLALELLGLTARRAYLASGECPRWLRRARGLIQDRCTSMITVGEIAAEVGVHPLHLARSYRKYFGQTPGEHLRACRVQRASDLLRCTRMPVGEVAVACGYSDQSQFTRSFRRATGLAPGAFRRA
jgi:AraC family transcriptional regulator